MSGEKKRGDFCGPGGEPPDSAVQVNRGRSSSVRTVMFIPDPDFFASLIPDLGSRIQQQ